MKNEIESKRARAMSESVICGMPAWAIDVSARTSSPAAGRVFSARMFTGYHTGGQARRSRSARPP